MMRGVPRESIDLLEKGFSCGLWLIVPQVCLTESRFAVLPDFVPTQIGKTQSALCPTYIPSGKPAQVLDVIGSIGKVKPSVGRMMCVWFNEILCSKAVVTKGGIELRTCGHFGTV
jgi:hypothetical protein